MNKEIGWLNLRNEKDWKQLCEEYAKSRIQQVKEYIESQPEEDRPYLKTLYIARLVMEGWLRKKDAAKLGLKGKTLESAIKAFEEMPKKTTYEYILK